MTTHSVSDGCPVRLTGLSLPAKVMVTVFLALVAMGYLVAALNIYEHHHDADVEAALTPDDIRCVYHGMHKLVTAETKTALPSSMLKAVLPGGKMRKQLEKGGEPAIRALVSWLEGGAAEAYFARADSPQPGDPSPQDVIARQCVRCHNAQSGDATDIPYAPAPDAAPQFAMVTKKAAAVLGPATQQSQTVYIAPMSFAQLVQVTHAHILSIPVFALIVGGLFLLTGLPAKAKLILGPLPLIAVLCDIASWWLARPFEPFIHVIAASGAVFGASFGVQILCVFGSMWFGRRAAPAG